MRKVLTVVSLVAFPYFAWAAPSCPATVAIASPLPHLQDSRAHPLPLSADEIAGSPALRRIASHGAQLFGLPVEHGLRAVFARNGNQFRVFYISPDGQAEIGGVMWDADGHNVTRDQVADIPGVIPTVRLGAAVRARQQVAGAGLSEEEASPPVMNPEAQLAATHYGLAGRDGAPRVYMVMDPLCPYSIRAYSALSPYVKAGRLQLALVPISINDHENGGASTSAALELLSVLPSAMGGAWTRIIALGGGEPDVAPSDTAAAALTLNLAAAHAIQTQGTPTLVWRDAQGSVHEQAGAPDDIGQFVDSLAR